MAKVKYIPSRGDIVWIDFDPIKGHEQAGRRPAVVISPEEYNKVSKLAIFCPITSKVKGNIFDVVFIGKSIKGSILTDQIRAMDFSKRDLDFVEKVSITTMHEVEAKLLTLIQV